MGGRSEAKGKIMLSTFIVTTVVVVVCYLTSAQFSHLSFPFHPFSQAPTTTTTTATVLVVADMMLTSWLVAGYHCLPIRIVFTLMMVMMMMGSQQMLTGHLLVHGSLFCREHFSRLLVLTHYEPPFFFFSSSPERGRGGWVVCVFFFRKSRKSLKFCLLL